MRSRTTRPARVRTAAPTAKQMTNTSRSDNRRSAGTQSGSSAVNGRTRLGDRLHALEQQQYRQVHRHDTNSPPTTVLTTNSRAYFIAGSPSTSSLAAVFRT